MANTRSFVLRKQKSCASETNLLPMNRENRRFQLQKQFSVDHSRSYGKDENVKWKTKENSVIPIVPAISGKPAVNRSGERCVLKCKKKKH